MEANHSESSYNENGEPLLPFLTKSVWTEYWDETEYAPYYVNNENEGNTQWEMPEEYLCKKLILVLLCF